jgi:superfamily II DNA or RNA helicase
MDPYEYQVDAFCHAVRNNRALFLSPTSSGKSYIIYLITRFYEGRKLIIVPTKGLIKQMHTDFQQYSKGTYDGLDHEMKWKDGVISDSIVTTWQSIYKLPQEFFNQFDVIIGDEAHHFQANSLTSILENSPNCKYRFGFTGTLDGAKAHKMILEGLFGKVYQTTTTKELMEDGKVAELSIKMINLKYPDKIRQGLAKAKYPDEIDYIISSKKRNNFIKNLTLSLKGNTLLLFQRVEDHGEKLYEIIKDEAANRKVFFVHGKTNVDAREEVRTVVEQENDAIIIASYGVFSTGISIKSINNVIFASPSKSRIRNLQSIGRGLRISESKTKCTLYDISDDFKWKTWTNHTLKHMQERFKIYSSEKFKIKLYNVKLK